MKLIQFLFVVSVLILPLSAQIIINAGDFQAQYSVGNSVVNNTDTIVTSINIGSLGSTSWDFSFLTLNLNYAIAVTSVDPASTPYISEFPGADYTLKVLANSQGIQSESYSYLRQSNNFEYMGSAGMSPIQPGFESIITTDPYMIVNAIPTTYNTNWDYTSNQTSVTKQNGNSVFTTNSTVISKNVVDAYGTMTMPGGAIVDALRIREDRTTLSNVGGFNIYDRHFSYIFLGKNGEQVTVIADTTQPNIGLISNYGYISWKNTWITAIGNENILPNQFSLEQNYPNPFNPNTSIKYAIGTNQFVSLKVYDILGNEVATLVNEEKLAGNYEVEFQSTVGSRHLASGIYFYKLSVSALPSQDGQAGPFVENKKMILMK